MAFQACPQCKRIVGIRGGKIASHYLFDDPETGERLPRLHKGKKQCALSGKPFYQSALSEHEKDILGPTTFD